jgi:hypothetical protein
MDKALEALHVAAAAIKLLAGVTNVTVDNDDDSGEIMFETERGCFTLTLSEDD